MTNLIEHAPWVGAVYGLGISGQRIAIVGYSHHRDEGEVDNGDFTKHTVRAVIAGDLLNDSFFPSVREYFGYDDRAAFWTTRCFSISYPTASALPMKDTVSAVQSRSNAAKHDSCELSLRRRSAQTRCSSSRKAWQSRPKTREEDSGKPLVRLGSEFPPQFAWGTYAAGDHIVMAFGLRHPQLAPCDPQKYFASG
ncbi:MAG: hypothetical protein ACLQAT_24285 [Candidatus Binataceae bacterium]